MIKKAVFLGVFAGLFVTASVLILILHQEDDGGSSNLEPAEEIERIKGAENLDEQVQVYIELIERVGPLEAQEHLYASGLPFTGETHLLNHTVGDYIFEEYGTDGLAYCKDYFLSSCYHGFLIRVIGSEGVSGVGEAVESCRSKGLPIYIQCAHAIGHGFLAYVGYENLTDALYLCDSVKRDIHNFPEYNCHDGVFMENIWGSHGGEISSDRWVRDGDLSYPCSDPRIEGKYLKGCWSNQPALIYQMLEGDVEAVGQECGKVKDASLRETCFDGLARQIHPVSAGNAERVFEMCGVLPDEESEKCLIVVVRSDLSVGGRELSFEICNSMHKEGIGGEACYENLIELTGYYTSSKKERTKWCEKIESVYWKNKCY